MARPVRLVAIAALLLVPLVSGCDILSLDVDGNGTVRLFDQEAGCWVIVTEDLIYEPTNLPQEYQIDQLRVWFEGRELNDRVGFCGAGLALELKKIRRAGG
jgi:hypothetical protein